MTRSLSRTVPAYLSRLKTACRSASRRAQTVSAPLDAHRKPPIDTIDRPDHAAASAPLPWPLSHGQQVCLHLVFAHMTSKEIARELGISPHTVDQRLRVAIRLMAVDTRFQAARKFIGFLNNIQVPDSRSYQPLIYQPARVAHSPDSDTLGESASSLTMPASRDGGSGDGMIAHVSGTGIGTGKGIGVSALPGSATTVPITRLSVFSTGQAPTKNACEELTGHQAPGMGRVASFGWTVILTLGFALILQSAIVIAGS